MGSVENSWGIDYALLPNREWNQKQKHKKQPFGDATALAGEGGGIAKRIKTARLRRKTNLQKSDYPKTRIKRGLNALCVVEYDNYVCI